MPRYKLRTLLIVLALGPMVLAGAWLLYRQTIPTLQPTEQDWRAIQKVGTRHNRR
jgi:hypothetical protein